MEYRDYADVFSPYLAIELSENTSINQYTIELIEGKQPPYGSIYSLGQVKLEMLKAYIKTYLKTGFIWLSKSPVDAPILFDEKPNGSFCLYVNYQGLNNLTIKNRYLMFLIGKSLNPLGSARQFSQLDLTNTYF